MAAGDNRVSQGRTVRKPADAGTGEKHAPRKRETKGRQGGDVESVARRALSPN